MAVYTGFFDAAIDEITGAYDRLYDAQDFTEYFAQLFGSGVCVYENEGSMQVSLDETGERALIAPGYLFLNGCWLKNDAVYTVSLTGLAAGIYAICARLNMSRRLIEIVALPRPVPETYVNTLALAYVTIPVSGAPTVEDTRSNAEICGLIDAAGSLSAKAAYALQYIDTEIEGKLHQIEADLRAQEDAIDAKLTEANTLIAKIAPPAIGAIQFSASQSVPEGWLHCDGSFISETDYPELVAALGKLTPGGDKFTLISAGEIPPGLSNGVLYAGRLWVYSFSAGKLYGIDAEGDQPVREIALTSTDSHFAGFITPATTKPLALSIVPHPDKAGAKLFLGQIVKSGGKSVAQQDLDWMEFCLLYQAEFTGAEDALDMIPPFMQTPVVAGEGSYKYYIRWDYDVCIPYVVSSMVNGAETYRMLPGAYYYTNGTFATGFLAWTEGAAMAQMGSAGIGGYTRTSNGNQSSVYQRVGLSHKNKGEAVGVSMVISSTESGSYDVSSYPGTLFQGKGNFPKGRARTSFCPLNIAGETGVVFSFDLDQLLFAPLAQTTGRFIRPTVHLPASARVFVDAGAYLWGKGVYMIFVGTGLLFSRTWATGDIGYLDTTSVLGVISQFGYLDYAQDENTLYILGQDTNNTVKAAKIALNTLYDYANDGAWLPMLAADGVPAFIKAREPV